MLKLPVIGLSTGGIVAIILAVIIVLVVLGYIVYLLLQKNKEEKPVKEKTVETKKVEEKPIKKEVKAEEPKVIKEEKPEVIKEEKPKVIVPVEPKKEMLNYSFKSRLHLADENTASRYSDLKNHIMKYEGVSANMSWKQETFVVKGKMVAKLRLQGKTMRVYFGLDPKDYVDTKYNLVDESTSKTHQSTPSLLVVKGPRLLQYALELVDDYMKAQEVPVNNEYKVQNYKEKPLTQEKLIEMKLIKTQKSVF